MTLPVSNRIYTQANGSASTAPFLTVIKTVSPTPQDINYPITQRWIVNDSTLGYPEYFLMSLLSSNGVVTANWVSTSVSLPVNVATQYTTDSGLAVPAANNLNVVGGPGCNTSGTGSTITVNITGGGFPWTDVITPTQAMSPDNGYITDNGAGVTYTLPASATLGQSIQVVGKLGITTIAQNAGQQILMGSGSSTVGVTGSVVGTNLGDCIELICITAGVNCVFRAADWVGNWTIN